MLTAHGLIITKIVPPEPRGLVDRAMAGELAREALTRDLVVVAAGAGYGKTSLLTQLARRVQPTAWLTVTAPDRDPDLFLAHFWLALARGLGQEPPPGAAQGAPAAVAPVPPGAGGGGGGPPAWVGLVNWLAGALAGDLLVILDDFHKVAGVPEVGALVESILEHRPAGLHLVLGSRTVPPLSLLPRWQVCGRAAVVAEEQLRLTRPEAAALLAHVCGRCPDDAMLNRLLEVTEGWAAGIQLLGQVLRGRPDYGAGPAGAAPWPVLRQGDAPGGGSAQVLFDYFSAEVLKAQDPETRKFLVEASVLDTLTPAACDGTLGRSDGRQLLRAIEGQGLFLLPVGPDCWRVHNLFRSFLQRELAADGARLRALHAAAAAYFAAAGESAEAIPHWLAAQRYDQAIACIRSVAARTIQDGRTATLGYWLELFPASELDRSPDLQYWRGFLLEVQGRWREALGWYRQAGAGYGREGNPAGQAEVYHRLARIAVWWEGRPAKAQRHERAAGRILAQGAAPPAGDQLKEMVLGILSRGHVDRARRLCRQAVAACRRAGDQEAEAWILLDPGAWVDWVQGDYEGILARLAEARCLMGPTPGLLFEVQEHNCRAAALVWLSRAVEARAAAGTALALAERLESTTWQAHAHRTLGLAWQLDPDHDLARAAAHLRLAIALAESIGDSRPLISASIGMLRLAHGTGDREGEARELARCRPLLRRNGDRSLVGFGLGNVGLALADSAPAEAEVLLERARRITTALGDDYHLTVALFGLAYLVRHDPDRLAQYLPGLAAGIRRYGAGLLECGFAAEAAALLMAAQGAGLPTEGLLPLAGGLPGASAARLARVAITTLGRFAVTVAGAAVPPAAWRGSRARDLCGLLAACHPSAVPKEQAVERLWPHLPWAAAENNLYKALHGLRRALDPAAALGRDRYVVLRAGALSLAPDVYVDTAAFVAHVEAGRRRAAAGDLAGARGEWLAAEQLFGGDFLAGGPGGEWAEGQRQHLRNLLAYLLEKLADAALAGGHDTDACLFLERLLALDPTREAVHRRLLEHLYRAGNHRQARERHERYVQMLRRDLGTGPAPETQELARRLFGKAI